MKPGILMAVMVCLMSASPTVVAMGDDDPLLTMLMLDRFELGLDDESPLLLEAQGWVGYDLNKLWLKTALEREDNQTEAADVELLYGRAVAPYWDFQLGWRRDIRPEPADDWLVFGFQGLAPYFFEVESTFYIGDEGRSAYQLTAGYELLLTQRLILSPDIALRFNGYNDSETGVGSGFASLEAGLQLYYEIVPEFAPYVGIQYQKVYGNSADYLRAEGEDVDELSLVMGVRLWF